LAVALQKYIMANPEAQLASLKNNSDFLRRISMDCESFKYFKEADEFREALDRELMQRMRDKPEADEQK
jgi:hypothetical protein